MLKWKNYIYDQLVAVIGGMLIFRLGAVFLGRTLQDHSFFSVL
jgi:hypothetical protein